MYPGRIIAKYGLIIYGIKITNHFIDRFIERTSMTNIQNNEGQFQKIFKLTLNSADCIFKWKNGAKALRTDFGIIVLQGKSVAVTFLEWSDLKKWQKKQIKGLPSNFTIKAA